MITSLRRGAKSWIIKILFGILVLSFAVWGIGDIFRSPGRDAVVASVGSVDITSRDFIDQYRRQTQRIREAIGANIDAEKARQLGLVDMVLWRLVSRTLFDHAARGLGLTVSDDLVKRKIRDNPMFRDEWGNFDDFLFRRFLSEGGYNEESYVSGLRQDTAREQLLSSVGAWIAPPETMTAPLIRYRQEKRVAEKVLVATADIVGFDSPDEASLAAFYEENAERFVSPEYRDITLVALKADDFTKEIAITEETLREVYEDRKMYYTSPELVNLEQIFVDDEEAAIGARKMLDEGSDFLQVAREVAGQNEEETALGWNLRDELLEEIADDVFALEEGGISRPLESPFGWHIVRVTGKKTESLKSFEDTRDEIRKELAAEESLDVLYDLIKEIEDAFAAGATLEEATRQFNLKTTRIPAIDSQGRDSDGNAVENLPADNFMRTVFSIPKGAQSDLKETRDNGFYVLRVNRVSPPARLPLDKARDAVTAAWREEQRVKSAKAEAELILERTSNGEDFTAVVKELMLETKTTELFLRADDISVGLTVELVAQLFEAKIGESFMARMKDGYLVVRLTSIEAANPDPKDAGNEAALGYIRGALVNDLIYQYGAAMRARHKITVNQRVIETLL